MKPKKDLNYIVGLEKAIAKKYGNIAIQNPAKFWDEEKEKEYLEQLKKQIKSDIRETHEEQVELDGFFIPKKLINKETNRICPECGIYSFSMEDNIYMIKYECCLKCYIEHVEDREERWLKGWRPKKNGRKEK